MALKWAFKCAECALETFLCFADNKWNRNYKPLSALHSENILRYSSLRCACINYVAIKYRFYSHSSTVRLLILSCSNSIFSRCVNKLFVDTLQHWCYEASGPILAQTMYKKAIESKRNLEKKILCHCLRRKYLKVCKDIESYFLRRWSKKEKYLIIFR
jgi:hypothetical protein